MRPCHLTPAACAALLAATAAAAPQVDAAKCPGLRASEVARLLELEVSTLAPRADVVPPFTLQLSCEGTDLRMRLFDPTTNKSLERSIPAPALSDPSRERVVALAASQLLVASWLELLMADKHQRDSLPKPTSTLARQVASRALRPPQPASPVYELGVGGGVVIRDMHQPLVLATGSLVASYWLHPRLVARAEAGMEDGSAERATGSVKVRVTALSIGLGSRVAATRWLGFEGFLLAGVGYVDASGRPSSDAYRGLNGHATAAVLQAGAGPVLTLKPVSVAATVRAGALTEAPRVTVAEDRPVRLDGAQLSFVLSVSLTSWE